MKIQIEQATVYRGGGRRWFTKAAAIKAEAKAYLFKKHGCTCEKHSDPDNGYYPETCYLHAMDTDRFKKYVRRVARMLVKESNNEI
jgi:hypothetical protein